MSYILDALKRSEQERQQGQSPNLTANDALLLIDQGRAQYWPYILIGVLFLNAAIYAFFQWRTAPASLDTIGADPSKATVLTPMVQVQDDVEVISNVKPLSMPYTPITSSSEYKAEAVLEKNTSVDEIKVKDEAALEPIERGTYVDGGLLIQPSEQAQSDSIQAGDPNPVILEDPDVVDSKILESTSLYGHVPLLIEMDKQFQRKVPTMTFNGHIYSDVASARRVTINDNYLREGQTFSGLDIVEIGENKLTLSLDRELFRMHVLRDWHAP